MLFWVLQVGSNIGQNTFSPVVWPAQIVCHLLNMEFQRKQSYPTQWWSNPNSEWNVSTFIVKQRMLKKCVLKTHNSVMVSYNENCTMYLYSICYLGLNISNRGNNEKNYLRCLFYSNNNNNKPLQQKEIDPWPHAVEWRWRVRSLQHEQWTIPFKVKSSENSTPNFTS